MIALSINQKNFFYKLQRFGALIGIFYLCTHAAFGIQLSGSYTIDPSLAATATNFKNFTSAITYLTSAGVRTDGGTANAAPFGVSGPVYFNVAQGSYAEQVSFSALIPGASTLNMVVFDGGAGNAATRVIIFTGNVANLSAVRYLQFNNLTFRGTGTLSTRGVNITGTAGMIRVKKCVIDVSAGGSAPSSSIRGITIETQADSVEIDSNEVNYGYYGIFASGAANAVNNASIKIRGNSLKNMYYYGIQVAAVYNSVDVSYNTISMSTPCQNNAQAFTMDNCPQNSGISHLIIGNKVLNGSKYAFRIINTSVSSLNPTKIYNNMVAFTSAANATGIGNTDRFGFEIMTGVVSFYHNTVYMYGTGTAALPKIYGLYFAGNDSSIFKNNILVCTGVLSATNPTSYPAYFAINPSGNRVNYNCYYNTLGSAANKNLVYRGGSSFTNVNYRTVSAGGDSSFNLLPVWKSADDLHFPGPCNLTTGVDLTALVPTDIDMESRSSTPHLGCDEYPTFINNLALTDLLQPTLPVNPGLQNLRVRFRNAGSSAITSFTVHYELNGQPPVTDVWSAGTLNTCDTVSVLFSIPPSLLPGVNTLKIYSSNPNATADGNNINDTIVVNLTTAMSGTYTIGASGADFSSFTQAANSLTGGGVSSPVTFLVKSGTYTEQFSLGSILGASLNNNITFQSMANHPDSVVLNYNASGSGNNYVIRLDKGSYITLRAMSVNALNTTNGRVIALMDSATYDTIENCRLTTASTTSSSDGTAVIYGFIQGINRITIRNNIISNGGYGVFMGQPNTSTMVKGYVTIDSNTIQNFYNENYFRNISKLRFRNNRVITGSTNTGITCFYYIYGPNTQDSLELSGNIMKQPGGEAIYIENPDVVYGIIANNSVAVTGPHNGTVSGIYGVGLKNMRIYHNSVNIAPGSVAGGSAVNLDAASATCELRNNIFSNENGGDAMTLNNMANFNSNYNNFYNNSGNLIRITGTGTNYANLNVWRASTAKDLNSIQYRPGFTSVNNLAPNPADTASWSVNGRGIHLNATLNPAIIKDIDGNNRPLTIVAGLPDLGAFQFKPTALAPLATPVPAVVNPGDTQAFVFLGDTVAKIYGASVTGPGVLVRQYVGEVPVNAVGATYHMYYAIDMQNPLSVSFNALVYYNNLWLGSIPTETDMRLAKRSTSVNSWMIDGGALIDTVKNSMHVFSLYEGYYSFSGSDITIPLPVKLLRFTAQKEGEQVSLKWSTASERNSDRFEIERSVNKNEWTMQGKVKASGNSNSMRSYQFSDQATGNRYTLFYRLRMVDQNGSFTYSDIIAVNPNEGKLQAHVFPNPLGDDLYIELQAMAVENIRLGVSDIRGNEIFSQEVSVKEGLNLLKLEQAASLEAGIYFLSYTLDGTTHTCKLMK